MKNGLIICYRTEPEMSSAYKWLIELRKKASDLFSVNKYLNVLPLEYPFTIVLETDDTGKLDDLLMEKRDFQFKNCEMYMLYGREHEIARMIPMEDEEEECNRKSIELQHILPADIINSVIKVINTARISGFKPSDPESLDEIKILLNKNKDRFKQDNVLPDYLAHVIVTQAEGLQ